MRDQALCNGTEWASLTPGQKRALDSLCSSGYPCQASSVSAGGQVHAGAATLLVVKGYARVVRHSARKTYIPTEVGKEVWLSCEPPYTDEELSR